jgi:hypothetical protein
MINAFMKGAKQVEIFDTNKLARYYIELKWTALKNLSYSEFKEFFFINKNAFTYQRYEKFREQLSF